MINARLAGGGCGRRRSAVVRSVGRGAGRQRGPRAGRRPSSGDIVLELDAARAPRTVGQLPALRRCRALRRRHVPSHRQDGQPAREPRQDRGDPGRRQRRQGQGWLSGRSRSSAPASPGCCTRTAPCRWRAARPTAPRRDGSSASTTSRRSTSAARGTPTARGSPRSGASCPGMDVVRKNPAGAVVVDSDDEHGSAEADAAHQDRQGRRA